MRSIKTCGLFEGIGGFPRAAQIIGGFDWRISIEQSPSACDVLRSNFQHPIWQGDISNFHPKPGEYDLLIGGFPCTGTSNAGLRSGLEHPESGAMFWQFLRCIGEARPSLILLEQPSGFIDRGLRAWIGGLRMGGYTSLHPLITRCDQLGAQFERERIFVLSYFDSGAWRKQPGCWSNKVRDLVSEIRNSSHWLTIEQRGDRISSQFPSELVSEYQPSISCATRHPGRLTARKLGGQTVTIPQARVALEWVKWLWGELR